MQDTLRLRLSDIYTYNEAGETLLMYGTVAIKYDELVFHFIHWLN